MRKTCNINLTTLLLIDFHASSNLIRYNRSYLRMIKSLRAICDKPIIKAFTIVSKDDIKKANESTADYILLDSGKGSGETFDWDLIKEVNRPYFLAGGLTLDNVENAVKTLHPFVVDVSSGIETDGFKDFVQAGQYYIF